MSVRYTRVGWQDAPSTDTPIDAANLNHMDNGILALSEEVDTELPLLQEQINDISTDIDTQIDEKVPPEVSSWLTEHVDPVGSAVVVDDSLTIQGAAADAKKTGDEISDLKDGLTAVESDVTDLKEDFQELAGISETLTPVKINGLLVVENGTAYENSPTQDAFYIPVEKDVTYKWSTGRSSGSPYVRMAFSEQLPANGVPFTFIGQKQITSDTPVEFSFVAPSDGYICESLYINQTNPSLMSIDGFKEGEVDNLQNRIDVLESTADNAESSINFLHDEINLINNIESTDYVDGYSASNSSTVNLSVSPFVYDSVETTKTFVVESLRLKCITPGEISLGVIKKSDFIDPPDMTKVNYKTTVSISRNAVDYSIGNPFRIEPDEYLLVGKPTDTGKWAYGADGTDKGFSYNATTSWLGSANSVGITVNGGYYQSYINSIYKGKSLSILGDSISTYNGYIPEGNLTYYPSGNVQAVTDTWWKKLIDALGMELSVNNSWSGSRVTTTAGDTSAGCMTRCESLGTSPDVIIVWMGINDFNNEVVVGTYDGSTALPTVTTTFREAYAIMLNKILAKYQKSEVWVCTLPQCERNAETGFPEINGNGVALAEFNKAIKELAEAFGVKVLDHNKSGLTYQNMPTFNPDNLHPTKYGHSLVANNDIWQMDNTVKTRYPIS